MIRSYQAADLEALLEMHSAQAFPICDPPEPDSPLVLTKLVAVDAAGAPTMALLVRLIAETNLFLYPRAGTPAARWNDLQALHEAARAETFARGLDSAVAFVQPRIAKSFGRRLRQLGWLPEPGTTYRRSTGDGK